MSPKVRLISAARHVYAGRLISVNEEFDAEPKDAEDLIALNFARRVKVVMPVATPIEQQTDEQAKLQPRKRLYRRRDMQAEGTE